MTITTTIPDALQRLRTTFASGKTRPVEWRLKQLSELERMVREHEPDFAAALQADLHKGSFETALSELGFVASEAQYARRHLRRWARPKRVSTPMMALPGSSHIQPEPKGVVLIIAPWNYPLSMVCAPLVGAIAAGNCAVLKPSEITSQTSAALARIIPRYLDNDAFAVIEGGVAETTELLEHHYDHILYTGNERVARIVMTAAAKHLTPVTLELGGKSPCLVDKSADLDVAASRIAWGKFINAGQTCVAPDHVLVHRSVAAEFTEILASKIRQFYGDDPSQSPDYCRIASERHTARFARLLEGQNIHTGGQVDVAKRYVAPTIVLDPDPASELMQEEIFGPVLPVITVDEMHHAIRFVADRPKPLALYLFTRSKALENAVLDGLSAGSVCINDAVIFMVSPELPFGGIGNSGMGRYTGWFGFETFSHMRPVMKRSFRFDAPMRYPPYNDFKRRIMELVR
ncbi:MAG: aldehyde dehydrogenase family protein [Gammaproteobacteria bacterium]|nr:aldehyde dehydrogenase family protein [Gammaproteobacteria bacterium]MDH4311181.1 aldehyde dehydrogenase family protein [Gammaproteobacteria bacterium]MDH5271590.1 aldehyde dehydrogenase family protein [Gammaproteobacteria bacterium]